MIPLFFCLQEITWGAENSVPITISKAQFSLTMAAYKGYLAKFSELPCIGKKSRKKISSLANHANVISHTIEREYKSYMDTVSKPMEGNGKCDEGFGSVAVESSKRASKSRIMKNRISDVQRFGGEVAKNNFFDPKISINLTHGRGCYAKGKELYKKISDTSEVLHVGFDGMKSSFQYEESRFMQFQATNASQGVKCGAADGSLVHPVAAGREPSSGPEMTYKVPLGKDRGKSGISQRRKTSESGPSSAGGK